MESSHFYIALFVHLVSLVAGFGAVIVIDTFGLLMLFSKVTLVMLKKVAAITQPLIWIGWTGLVISGLNLIVLKGYLDNLTLIKLFFVLLLGFNGIFLHYIKKALDKCQSFEQIPFIWRFRIGMASLVSQTGWWGAIFIGFIHRHIQHNINWPQNPLLWIGGILTLLLLLSAFGEIQFRKHPKS